MSFVEIPIFEGVELRQWIDWMEKRFESIGLYGNSELQKLNLARILIEGEAASYINQSRLPFRSWTALKNWFGEDDDPEKLRLQEKSRRFLERCRKEKAQRDAAKIQRKEELIQDTKSIDETESSCAKESLEKKLIESTESIMEKYSVQETETDALVHDLDVIQETHSIQDQEPCENTDSTLATVVVLQQKSIPPQVSNHAEVFPHIQVPVSKREPRFIFHNELLVVYEDYHSGFGLDVLFDHQKERIHVLDFLEGAEFSEKSTYVQSTALAYQMFDRMLLKGQTLQQTTRQKKCAKSWRFKFKSRKEEKWRLYPLFLYLEKLNELEMDRVSRRKEDQLLKSLRFKYKRRHNQMILKPGTTQLLLQQKVSAEEYTDSEMLMKQYSCLDHFAVWHCFQQKEPQKRSMTLFSCLQPNRTLEFLGLLLQNEDVFLPSWFASVTYEYMVKVWVLLQGCHKVDTALSQPKQMKEKKMQELYLWKCSITTEWQSFKSCSGVNLVI